MDGGYNVQLAPASRRALKADSNRARQAAVLTAVDIAAGNSEWLFLRSELRVHTGKVGSDGIHDRNLWCLQELVAARIVAAT